jgi:hypothetical protein
VFSYSLAKTNLANDMVDYGSLPANDRVVYGYFLIEPTFKFGCRENAVMEIEYFSGGSGEFGFTFDGQKGAYTHCDGGVPLENVGRWKVARWSMKDVRFENSQNGGADFRIWTLGAFVRRVTLIRLPRADLGIPPRAADVSTKLIDLSFFYNGGLSTNWHGDAPANNLANLGTGVRHLAGTDFDVRGLVQVALNSPRHPATVRDIPVEQTCQQLHFLHAAIDEARATNSPVIGRYVVRFEDGNRNEIPIIIGTNTGDWWDVFPPRDAVVAWRGVNERSRRARAKVRLFKMTWKNPHPNLVVRSVDLEASQPKAAPFLVALTAE